MRMAAANCSRALDTEKFRYGSVKKARPLPTSGCECESLCLSAASARRSCSDLVFAAEIFSCGDANSTDTSALSMKPALSQLSLLVFSKSRRTKYAMPGIISPTGTYSRMRKPMSETANFKASAMPCNICNSIAEGGKPNCSAVAKVAAILRALWLPSANLVPPSPTLRGQCCKKIFCMRSKHASVSTLVDQTGHGHPCCSA